MTDTRIQAGRDALARGAWNEARALFRTVLDEQETPEAYAGLGTAARYALDGHSAIEAHERGFRLARELGDDDAAALLAVQLSLDAYAFTGIAEATGWVERARMLVDGRPATPASGFVPFIDGYLALLAHHDPDTALPLAVEAGQLARATQAVDLEFLARALEGLSLVSVGRIDDGMRRLDAAAASAVAGEMTDVDSIETVCCLLIDACKRVRDLERASEWCVRVRGIAERFGDRQMFSICRTHYADVLLWYGDWDEAERELLAAVDELGRLRPGRDVDALIRLAELRRRQGRQRETEALLARATTHRFHPLVAGLLALDRAEPATAAEEAARFLRRIGTRDVFERVAGLDLAVRAAVAARDEVGARAAADELAAISRSVETAPLRAGALAAEGAVAGLRGETTLATALLEDAADLFTAVGASYDAALTRLALASVLEAAGHHGSARRARSQAQDALRALGAAPPPEPPSLLTNREEQVLRLVALGLSNEDIARRLTLSVRTVDRHVANVYAKIGASGRTARAVATAWAHTHGIG
jgi:DNA-binding CsgD family transcriptional regulator